MSDNFDRLSVGEIRGAYAKMVERLRMARDELRQARDNLVKEIDRAEGEKVRADRLEAELTELKAKVNVPEVEDFARAVVSEAAHQRVRWGSEHDEGKTPVDWFWLLGWLAGKAVHAFAGGDVQKGLDHVVTAAAACANWHAQVQGKSDMRPGIASPAGFEADPLDEPCPKCGARMGQHKVSTTAKDGRSETSCPYPAELAG